MMSTTRPTESRAHVLFLRLPPILFKCHPRQFHSKSPTIILPFRHQQRKKINPKPSTRTPFYLCLYFLLSRIILFRADCRHYTRVPVPEHTQNRISTPPNKPKPTPTPIWYKVPPPRIKDSRSISDPPSQGSRFAV